MSSPVANETIAEASPPKWAQWSGMAAGPLAAIAVYLLVPSVGGDGAALSEGGRAVVAVGTLMAVWWMTEALPIEATSLLPLLLFPLLGANSIDDAAAPYASKEIFLFMGGFMLGAAMERWGLHRRIALMTMSVVGTSPLMLIAGLMLVTAGMSMWVSNTATAIVMLPIGMSVVRTALEAPGAPAGDRTAPGSRGAANFGACVVLGIAYAASIGGLGTLIGTPPNTFLAGFYEKSMGQTLSFQRWLWVGVPLVALFLPLSWAALTLVAFPVRSVKIGGARAMIREQLAALGPMRGTEWAVLATFLGAAGAWIFRPQICRALGLVRTDSSGNESPLLSDAGIAIGAALVLFVIPVSVKERKFVLDWPTASRLPWGVLLLFGGGLSLADAMTSTGCNVFLGSLFTGIERLPTWLMVLVIAATVTFLSELASNIAVTAAMLPVMRAVEVKLNLAPGALLIPTTLAASCGFMLPVATAPNALAFATGQAPMRSMLRGGILLDIIGVALITLVTTLLGPRVLGTNGPAQPPGSAGASPVAPSDLRSSAASSPAR